MKRIFFLILFCFLLISCEGYFDYVDSVSNYVTSVSFNSGSYSVYEQGMTACYLSSEPSDSFDYYEPEFTLSDSETASITKTGANYCILTGKKAGSAVLTATLNNVKCQTVINVLANN